MRRQGGFTLIGLMVSVAIIGITMSVMGMTLKTVSRIEKEKELLWIGHQFRQAIKLYSTAIPVPAGHPTPYPADLKDLLKDPRRPGNNRYLRKSFIDPITGKDDWVVIQGENGRIRGVHSNSDRETLKRDNFELLNFKFKDKTRYSEWIFDYDPVAIAALTGVPPPGSLTPGTAPTAPPGGNPPPAPPGGNPTVVGPKP